MIKYIFFILIIAGLYSCNTHVLDHQYKISGVLSDLKDDAVVYVLSSRGELIDSAIISKGVFEVAGSLEESRKVFVFLDHDKSGLKKLMKTPNRDALEMYLEERVISLTGVDSVQTATLEGSELNTEFVGYKKENKPLENKLSFVIKRYYEASDSLKNSEGFEEEIDNEYNAIQEDILKLKKDYVKGHTTSFVSLDLLKEMAQPVMDVEVVEPLFTSLSQELQNSESGKEFKVLIENNKKVSIGAIAPDFSLLTPSGDSIRLSDLRGKFLLVDFWASWCGPCRRENPNVVNAFKTYGDKNFTVLGVSLDKSKDAWMKAIEDDGLTWAHVSDLKGWSNAVAQLYMVKSIPQNFLLDPQGKIIAKNLRGEDLNKKLETVLN